MLHPRYRARCNGTESGVRQPDGCPGPVRSHDSVAIRAPAYLLEDRIYPCVIWRKQALYRAAKVLLSRTWRGVQASTFRREERPPP